MKAVFIGSAVLGLSLISGAIVSAQQRQTTTVFTGRDGKTATTVTSVDADRADGRVGVEQTLTGPQGRVATRSSSTTRQDGAVVHQENRSAFDGRSASRQDTYTRDGSTHTRTGRAGRTRSWSRSR
jgi:hypothetical protein